MFERFTDRARRVVVLAQEEARLLNHNYIGTEHILLGLLHEGEGIAARSLTSLGISIERVRADVAEIIGEGSGTPAGHIPFTPRAKKVLELSLREALQLAHNYIGTEHVLLGLIREGNGVACQVLMKHGADVAKVRQQVMQILSGYEGAPEEFTTPEPPATAAPFARVPPSPPTSECLLCGRRPIDTGLAVAGYRGHVCEACVKRAARYFNVARKLGSTQAILTMPPMVEGRAPAGVSTDQVVSVLRAAFDPNVDEGERAAAVEGGAAVATGFDGVLRRNISIVRVKFTKKQILAEVALRGGREPFTVQLAQEGDRLVVAKTSFRDFARLQLVTPFLPE